MTGETPVLDTLTDLTAAPFEHNRGERGHRPMTCRVVIAVAPIAGTARMAPVGGKILRARASHALRPTPRWPATAAPSSSRDPALQ
jgi:hypothetical protein